MFFWTAPFPRFSHVHRTPATPLSPGLFLAHSWDEGPRCSDVSRLDELARVCYRSLKQSCVSRLLHPQKYDARDTLEFSRRFGRESVRRPSSSLSPSFITNVFTANQRNGLDCEHFDVFNVYTLSASGDDAALTRTGVVILNYKDYSRTCQAPLYPAWSSSIASFMCWICYATRLYKVFIKSL